MTKAMTDALNLPSLTEALKAINEDKTDELLDPSKPDESVAAMAKALEDTSKIEKALVSATDLVEHDKEMDEISTEAMKSYKDMMELGFNVEHKYSGSIFEPAVNMLKLALDARNAKVEKKLRLMKLKMDQQRLDMSKPVEEGMVEGDGHIVMDRNHLMSILNSKKTK